MIAAGRSPGTLALAVEQAGGAEARLYHGTLATLADRLTDTRGGPMLIVIGEVAAQALDAREASPVLSRAVC